jgi:hypothetical protein
VGNKAQNWVFDIQDKLRSQISNELITNGYAVLINLIDLLELELRENVLPELLKDHDEFAKAISGFNQQNFFNQINEIGAGLDKISTKDGLFLAKLSQTLARVFEFQINSYVNALAASILQDMLSSFIAPLREQLTDSRFELQRNFRSNLLPNGARNPFLDFPSWGSGRVPNQYKSRSLERVLIDSSAYETTYVFYASKDSHGEPAFQQSVHFALLGQDMNLLPGGLNSQTLITVDSPWMTTVRDAQGQIGFTASKSKWSFQKEIDDLSKRNRAWLRNLETSFGKFATMSIRDYVGEVGADPHTRTARETAFVREFREMLRMSQPLISLNPKALAHILSANDGNYAGGILSRSSKIPFAVNSSVGEACTRILQENGYHPANPGFEQNWFDAGSNDSTMLTASTNQASLPAWAFASLTEPILERVAQSINQSWTWNQFWEGRRTRPLVESIPFETEVRRSIITGWFIATLFGMRKVETVHVGRTVQIWNPTLEIPGWSKFPSPLLNSHHEDMSRRSWVLPQLLLSAGIALANFGKSGDPEYINGYRLLKYLGREVTTSIRNRDSWDGNGRGDVLPTGKPSQSNCLRGWVETGELPHKILELSKVLQQNIALGADRREALIKTVDLIRTQYANIWNEMSSTAWHNLPETWELKDDIDLALIDIAEYVSELKDEAPRTSD